MTQADFRYAPVREAEAMPLTASIFADRPHVLAQMSEDVEAAGFSLRETGPVATLLDEDLRVLGEVVLLDCGMLDAASMAALSRLDMRAARSGAQLVISTAMEALEDVFACCDQSEPQILVDPGRAERVVALGRVLARVPNLRVRELSEEDRLTLLRLTEQVAQIAQRLEALSASAGDRAGEGESAFRFESPRQDFRGVDHGGERLGRSIRPSLPDPRLVRRIIHQRQLRARFFDGELFADPAWDILLDLTAARAEHKRVSVTSLCIASGVPPTTALRWISQMTKVGLLERVEDETDRRRAFIALSDKAAEAMARYFAEMGKSAMHLV